MPLPLSELGDESGIYRPVEHLNRQPSIRAGRPLFLWPRSPPASPAQPGQPPIDAPAPRRTGPRGWQARVTVLMPDKRGEVTAHAACAPEPWAALSPTYPGQPSSPTYPGQPSPMKYPARISRAQIHFTRAYYACTDRFYELCECTLCPVGDAVPRARLYPPNLCRKFT